MPFDGNGNWVADFSAIADRDANIKIMASRFDNIHQADLKESFENCLTKDAQVKPLTHFNANNFRIINVSNPIQDNDALNKQTLDSTISTLLSSLYPVGSLYIGTQSTCPLATLIVGSTWELIEGRYLLASGTLNGTSETYTAGSFVVAGLPDHYHTVDNGGTTDADNTWGNYNWLQTIGDRKTGTKNTSNASSVNSMYGQSTTVRPTAYVVNVWCRTE